ncbi:MAG TPA: protein kinase, partial [Bacteroidota bacterium]
GQTLRDRTKSHIVNPKSAIDIGVQIADGLAAAHEKGIVHRDIKPENIMVRRDGIVQIMDFGLAKLRGVSRLTKEGSTVGTAGYMSPEQVQGVEADHRSDIFSLGVLLYELFTGQLPFRGVHETAMAYEIVNVDAKPMSSLKPEINHDLDRIILECLEKDPNERMQSAKQVAVALKRIRRDSGKQGVSQVHRVAAPPANNAGQERAAPMITRSGNRKPFIIGIIALLLSLAAAWYFFGRTDVAINSMVVLPFENVGADPDLEYLSEGVTDGIINNVSKIPDIRVIPRSASFRFKGTSKDPSAIGKELGVDAVLSGRVVQRGDKLDLTLELIDVREYSHMWGKSYKRTMNDLITVQDEIVDEVRKVIKPGTTSASEVERVQTTNPAAYRLYLQGKYYWNKRTAPDLERALSYFHQAIALDGEFALAHLGVAETFLLQGQYSDKRSASMMQTTTEEALRSLELDNSLGQAHAALGMIREYDWDWEAAEREFKLAIEKAPEYATAYHWYFIFLSVMGRDDEAFTIMKKGAELDPYSPIVLTNLADAYIRRKDYASATGVVQKILDIDPQFFFGKVFSAIILKEQAKIKEAVKFLDEIPLSGLSSNNLGFVGNTYAALGERSKATLILRRLLADHKSKTVDPVAIAMVYAGLGDTDSTIAWLQKGLEERSELLPNTRAWEQFDVIHKDPRYFAILKKMGL